MLSARTLNGSAAKAASEEVAGLGLAADLHVEHPQADLGRRLGSGSACDREQEGALGRVVLAAVGQALAEGGVEGRPDAG